MSLPEDKIIDVLKTLPKKDKEEVLDFAEYLKAKRNKKFKNIIKNIPEGVEYLSEKDLKSIQKARENFKTGQVYSIEEIEKKYNIE